MAPATGETSSRQLDGRCRAPALPRSALESTGRDAARPPVSLSFSVIASMYIYISFGQMLCDFGCMNERTMKYNCTLYPFISNLSCICEALAAHHHGACRIQEGRGLRPDIAESDIASILEPSDYMYSLKKVKFQRFSPQFQSWKAKKKKI